MEDMFNYNCFWGVTTRRRRRRRGGKRIRRSNVGERCQSMGQGVFCCRRFVMEECIFSLARQRCLLLDGGVFYRFRNERVLASWEQRHLLMWVASVNCNLQNVRQMLLSIP